MQRYSEKPSFFSRPRIGCGADIIRRFHYASDFVHLLLGQEIYALQQRVSREVLRNNSVFLDVHVCRTTQKVTSCFK